MKYSGLDLKDKRILFETDLNARLFISDIAKRVKLNKEVVKYRIRNLEKKGIIKGYQTLINTSKLGLVEFEYGINVMDVTHEELEKMREYLVAHKNVIKVSECDVVWDIVVNLVARNHNDFHKFYFEFKNAFRKYIEKDSISLLTGHKFCSRTYVEGEEKQFIDIPFSDENGDFDATDLNLLRLMAFDAKAPLIELAKKLNIDSMTVKKRIQKLQKSGIICGFKNVVDTQHLNVQRLSIRLQLFDTSRLSALDEYISRLPQTVLIRKSVSNYDMEFEVEVQDFFELSDMLFNIKKEFPIIREITHFTTVHVHKETSFTKILDSLL